MSHPPETSLSSRELAVEIANQLGSAEMLQGPYLDIVPIVEKLIEAWVRVRAAEASLAEARRWAHSWGIISDHSASTCGDCARLASLTAAIEQLKGATHGQAEAPSAAASANSEPGGTDDT